MIYPERFRKKHPLLTVDYFVIPFRTTNLHVMASTHSDGLYGLWEHVSVSLKNRNPNWDEMCFIKEMFWGEDSQCIQFHPRKRDNVNLAEHCLHIWKPPIKFENLLEGKL